jgi:hypothetical protein
MYNLFRFLEEHPVYKPIFLAIPLFIGIGLVYFSYIYDMDKDTRYTMIAFGFMFIMDTGLLVFFYRRWRNKFDKMVDDEMKSRRGSRIDDKSE